MLLIFDYQHFVSKRYYGFKHLVEIIRINIV